MEIYFTFTFYVENKLAWPLALAGNYVFLSLKPELSPGIKKII